MKTDQTGWNGILEQGEAIIWQRRPHTGFRVKLSQAAAIPFGLVFSGFALFWMDMASRDGGIFWTFGLIHFFTGIGIGLGPILIGNLRRKNSLYPVDIGFENVEDAQHVVTSIRNIQKARAQ